MDWLNYHHLLYFWVVAREGSIVKASKLLRLAQPTISGQIRELEDRLGDKLFVRVGRNLELSELGHFVYRYADEIFSLGRELTDALRGRPTGRPVRLMVGIADVIPKIVAYRLLAPALTMPETVQVVCLEDSPERLLTALSTHALDLVIAEAPIGPGISVKAYSHLLGECGVSFFGVPALVNPLRTDFPKSLSGAPILLPTEDSTLRRALEQWFGRVGVRPILRGEFQDSALMKAFGQAGVGIFAGPTAIEGDIQAQYGVEVLGRTEEIRERFYVISIEKKLKNPAVLAITTAARTQLFGAAPLPSPLPPFTPPSEGG